MGDPASALPGPGVWMIAEPKMELRKLGQLEVASVCKMALEQAGPDLDFSRITIFGAHMDRGENVKRFRELSRCLSGEDGAVMLSISDMGWCDLCREHHTGVCPWSAIEERYD